MTAKHEAIDVSPGPSKGSVTMPDGRVVEVPDSWALLPPGDAGLTRRVKASGPSWTVKEKKGRRTFSLGVWAPQQQIEQAIASVAAQRETPAYAKKRAADAAARQRKQAAYVTEFHKAVLDFLDFTDQHQSLAQQVASAVTAHATPVGSGTVARTQRISVHRRAESAVIAWMRHQTTAYDHMKIPRVKGQRREIRRMLAAQSRKLLDRYRRDAAVQNTTCPLRLALENRSDSSSSSSPQ